MATVTNGRLLFNEVPEGYPVPGKTTVYDESSKIDLENVALHGGFLVKVLVLSIDPYLRGRMRHAEISTYIAPFTVGEPLANFGVGVVIRSESPAVKSGDHLYGIYPFVQYTVQNNAQAFRVIDNKLNLPLSAYIGVCGMPGETAYYAWKEYASPNDIADRLSTQGDVVFVSTAAGPVGATVVQLAKADGLKVIASAGSDDKVAFATSIGADVAFNYKTVSTRKILEKEGPSTCTYWDNVGGETLEAAIEYAGKGARFIECGMISAYNTKTPYGVANLINIIAQEIHIYGSVVSSLRNKYVEEFYSQFVPRVASGDIKYKEHLVRGLENAGEAILDVQSGKNFGKCVVVVAEE
ncbi:NAD-P-binding protein [Lentinus brumalis]|uniref:NAD-P-binding protein n=1 Tax=Lentinus brumalis TaxID=2498619 RepID=A0A371DQZ8_9APHY|nr:NAD-P-binding protein [Polyporus brumalis]